MKIKVQVVVEFDNGVSETMTDIASFERDQLSADTLGLTLAEARDVLARLQETLVQHQVDAHLQEQSHCPQCGADRARKGQHQIMMRTLFGKLALRSPRFYTCDCEDTEQQSFSPLAHQLPERTTPELLYLETKWAALMSYGLTVDLLQEVLPVEINATSLKRQVHQIATRYEHELGDEPAYGFEGYPDHWAQLPDSGNAFTVGLDGGYVHAREGDDRKAGWFEVIVGKSIPLDGGPKQFGFVTSYDQKPRRRLFDVLQSQGLQINQDITFLSDGGDTVRQLPFALHPHADHILDWFHLTMRLTVLRQMVKGLPDALPLDDPPDWDHEYERIKWFLWHGNVFRALQTLEDLLVDLEMLSDLLPLTAVRKLLKNTQDLEGYIQANRAFIPNYGDRYRYGETISTAFVESTVNQVISKRFVKKQQMRWTKRGAHLLLQIRIQVLNQDWRTLFEQWYPGLTLEQLPDALAA